MLKGIDISKYQNGIDISKLDVDFVICKATEGVGYTDNCCDKFYQQAKKAGKKLGVYHYARPDLGNTAIVEADYFLKETTGYHKEAILVLDWEAGDLGNISWAKAWLDRVYEKTGVKPMIYMSESPANSYDWSSVANADYGIWVAKYGSNNGQQGTKPTAKDWPFIAMWQYTSKGRLNGYNGNLDLDIFYGDKTAWDKYAGGYPSTSSGSTSTSTISTKSVDELAQEVIQGKYGNGDARKKALGSRYDEVQARVNEILGVNNAVYYTVQKNDNLTKIAKKYGTTVNQLVAWNNIANPNLIYAGQKLRVK